MYDFTDEGVSGPTIGRELTVSVKHIIGENGGLDPAKAKQIILYIRRYIFEECYSITLDFTTMEGLNFNFCREMFRLMNMLRPLDSWIKVFDMKGLKPSHHMTMLYALRSVRKDLKGLAIIPKPDIEDPFDKGIP